MSHAGSERDLLPARYCLHCFSADVEDVEGTLVCPHCHGRSRRADRREYWTLHPGVHRWERFLKGLLLLVFLLLLGSIFSTMVVPGHGVRKVRWFYLLGVAGYGAVLWKTISLLRRRDHSFGAAIVWRITLGIWLVPVLIVAAALPRGASLVPLTVAGAIVSVIAFGPRAFRRYQSSWIRRGADPALRDRFVGVPVPGGEKENLDRADLRVCLHCHHPSRAKQGRSWSCSACGATNTHFQSVHSWSNHPRFRRLRKTLSTGFWLGPLLVGAGARLFVHRHLGDDAAIAAATSMMTVAMKLLAVSLGPILAARHLLERRPNWTALGAAATSAVVAVSWNLEALGRHPRSTGLLLGAWGAWLGLALLFWFVLGPRAARSLAEAGGDRSLR
ncbi:MAG: hypothetical protein R3F20_13445 [Planctomycetota bacterium]